MNGRAPDVAVVGAGPNGLAAAIHLAEAGLGVRVYEAATAVGGGTRTEALTLPGFLHDVCATVVPLARGSPFFERLPLASYGVEWVEPPVALAHPFDDGSVAILERSISSSAASLGPDGGRYIRLIEPLVRDWHLVAPDVLGPLRLPRHPAAFARFGLRALASARSIASRFEGPKARALMAGLAAHSGLPLEVPLGAGTALVLAIAAHAVGWPFVRGGTQRLSEALAAHLATLGGEVVTGRPVVSLAELPRCRAIVCDVTPRQLLSMAGPLLRGTARRRLEGFRYGVASHKVDWALSGPIPWTAPKAARAGTVHLGGSDAEIARSEREANGGTPPERPFVLVTQPSLFDASRAPDGRHTAWAYCHLPHGSEADMTGAIERQIERFAPGFSPRILARTVHSPLSLERHDPNLIGGHIGGGSGDWRQHFWRPSRSLYRSGIPGVYLCSASTPPGGGVHGQCGYHAACAVLADLSR